VFVLDIIDGPTLRIGFPNIPGVVTDDAAVHALHAARCDLVRKFLNRRERISCDWSLLEGDRARGKIRVSSSDQIKRSRGAAVRIRQCGGQSARVKSKAWS